MRLKVIFDADFDMGPYSKMILPVPASIDLVRDLTDLVRETFGLPENKTGRIIFSLDDFVLKETLRVSEVLRNDDVITARKDDLLVSHQDLLQPSKHISSREDGDESPALKYPRIEPESQPQDNHLGSSVKSEAEKPIYSTSKVEMHLELDSRAFLEYIPSEGDRITFTDESITQRLEGTVREVFVDQATGETLISFSHTNGPIDILPLVQMKDLAPLDQEASPALRIHPPPVKNAVETQAEIDLEHIKRAELWRKKQENKSFAALRRQIEWYVKQERTVDINDLLNRPRIKDLCGSMEDLVSAIEDSKLVEISKTDAQYITLVIT